MEYIVIFSEIGKVLFGLVIGTIFTSWYKDIKDKKNAQRDLFLRMITAKGYIQITQSFIDDLNTIEILFRGNKKVLNKYRTYYSDLCLPNDQVDTNRQHGLYWDLLREIGNVVGYSNLDNKTLNSSYIPNAALDEYLSNQEFRNELLSYLKNGNHLYSILAEQNNNIKNTSG